MSEGRTMSLEEKVGQLLMFGFDGTEPSPTAKRLLSERHAGGVILFYRNIRDGNHLPELVAELEALATRPLLLAADQEGGSVLRVRQGASLLPSAMGLARLGPEAVREAATICGREMRAMGLNINLAPVLDVNNPANPGIGIRSFSSATGEVARLGESYTMALQATGVLACVKHFPGKGSARLDAHLDLPVIDSTPEKVRSRDLAPFQRAFAAGAAAAMTSHCVYSKWDDRPATLSKRILTGLLRDELRFDGILITDDMEMGAIARYHKGTDAAVAAFEAGADVILICRDPKLQESAIDAIVRAVKSGQIPKSRLDESIARINRAKERIGPKPSDRIDKLAQSHEPRIQSLCDRIVHVDRDPARRLPLSGEAVDLYWPNMSLLTNVEEGSAGQEKIEAAFKARFGNVRVIGYNPKDPKVEIGSDQSRSVVFFSANAHLFPGQSKLISEISSRFDRFVLVVLRNPYDRDLVPHEKTVVLNFGFLPNAIEAVLKKLLPREG